jgi:hypothetical protein
MSLVAGAAEQPAPALRITSPRPEAVISGATRVEATVEPAEVLSTVQSVSFFANGRLVCTVERQPFG